MREASLLRGESPAPNAEEEPVAVIDIGSNSGRMVVFRPREAGHLDILEDARAPLRLGRALKDGDMLGNDAIDRTLEVLQDFRAVAPPVMSFTQGRRR